jgi:hypothetical protein
MTNCSDAPNVGHTSGMSFGKSSIRALVAYNALMATARSTRNV